MALNPVVLSLSEGGATLARNLAEALGGAHHGMTGRVGEADVQFENAIAHVQTLFAAGRPIIGICASGILIRAVAPLLGNKHSEPPVVSVSEDGAAVVPLLGGHRGANNLARQVAGITSGHAAVTTAGDTALGIALDAPPPGLSLANPQDAKAVMAALLAGAGARLEGEADWLSGLTQGEDVRLVTSLAPQENGPQTLHYAPLQVTLGLGCARNCDPEELWTLIEASLAEAEISPAAIHSVNTIDLKADEPAIIDAARHLDVPLRLWTAAELDAAADEVPNPSKVVHAEVGTRSVSEASAVLQADGGKLLLPKRKSANATCALGLAPGPLTGMRGRPRGKLSILGIGPGQADWRTPEVSRLVTEAEELIGYGLYIDLLGPLAAGKSRSDFPLGGEEARCRYALERAGEGRNVALICSGDAGIYAMGALVFELMDRDEASEAGVSDAARRVEVVSSPGVSALQAAAARAGAPLGHDFCAISLSDLLTHREDILRRIRAASEGDFVIAFYNPVSRKRRTLLAEAREMLLQHRPRDTPVLLATSLGRPEEHIRYRKLAELHVDEVDMLTVVLVGSSQSRLAQLGESPRMYTPRGYARKIDGDLSEGRDTA